MEATSAPPDARPVFGDAPPVSYVQRTLRFQPLHGRTVATWLIVFMPFLHAAAVIGSTFFVAGAPNLADGVSDGSSTAMPTAAVIAAFGDWALLAVIPLGVAFFVFTLLAGFRDRARLRLLGHDRTASPWWLLLSPFIYLIVRSVRVRQSTGRRGSAPLTTYICLYVAPPIAIVIASVVISALDGALPA